MSDVRPQALRELAEACARLGGSIVRQAHVRGATTAREKAPNDLVTEVDAASEAAISAFLRERRPGDGLLAEESATGGVAGAPRPPSADRCVSWIVDPLDGTTNFVHGYPAFGVSVAARGPDGLLAGAIYDPTRDELFSSARGLGATLNGAPIGVTDVDPPVALVGTGFPFRHKQWREAYLESFRRVTAAVSDVRRGGSASLDLAYVACGRLDGFWELGLSPWDMAAGWLLIEEAGGRVSDERGGPEVFERGHVVAGGPSMHGALLEIVRPAFEGSVSAMARWRL
jgi:myo-inositol-1(or 4)-monophosphatase